MFSGANVRIIFHCANIPIIFFTLKVRFLPPCAYSHHKSTSISYPTFYASTSKQHNHLTTPNHTWHTFSTSYCVIRITTWHEDNKIVRQRCCTSRIILVTLKKSSNDKRAAYSSRATGTAISRDRDIYTPLPPRRAVQCCRACGCRDYEDI